MSLISCEIILILISSSTYVITNTTGEGTFAITDTNHYVPVVTLLTWYNVKMLEQLKSGFKRAINWNKYLSKVSTERQKPYSTDPSFEGVNRLFALSFEDNVVRNGHRRYFIPTLEIKDYNILTDGKNYFDNIQKVSTG